MKKKFLSKALAATLTAVMVLSAVGCGSKESDEKEPSQESSEEEATEEKAYSGKVVINAGGAGHNPAIPEAIEVLKGMDKYKDVEFELLPYEGEEYEHTMPIQVMGGEQIDIVFNGNPMQQEAFISGDITVPMTEQVEKYGVDLEKTYGSYAKYAYNNDEVYGIPAAATVWGLFYNKKIFDDAGIAYPDEKVPMTWDEYTELAKQLTSGTGGDKTYGALHLEWPQFWYGEAIMALDGGEAFYKEDGSSNFDDPAFRKALERTHKMMHEDQSIRTTADILTTKTISQAFFTGQYGMFLQGTWTLNWLLDQEENPRDFEVGLAPLPVDAGTTQKNWGICGTFSMTQTTVDKDLSFNVIVDLVRETTKLTSSEIFADQTVPQDNLFVDVVNGITPTDSQFTPEYVKSIFLNPEMKFVSEKITGPSALEYETIMMEETGLYFANEQDIDTTITNVVNRVNKVLGK